MIPRALVGFLLLVFFSFEVRPESLTSSNIRGQKYLFENGWYVITSPVEAWKYALENSEQSREAFLKALMKAQENAETPKLKENLAEAAKSMKAIYGSGNEASKKISKVGAKEAQKNLQRSREQLDLAWKKFTLGYVEYRKNNEEDLAALKKLNQEFFKRHQEDAQSLGRAVEVVFGKFLDRNEVKWQKYFKEGTYQFQKQYERSGTRSNSIQGVWDVLVGYGKFFYNSVFRPSGKVLKKGVVNSGYYATEVVLHTFIAAYNVIYSSGANLYYSFKLGYKVIAPTVEAGWYSSLALINAASAPVVWGGLETAGVVTKVATTATAPLVGATQFTIAESVDTAKKAAVYLYHGGTGTVRVGLETLESGIVLGYSALSQIPPQLLLTSMNSAIFLVYDGPRMILVKAQGKVGDKDVTEVPVGTVMDMKKLQEEGVDIVPITNDEFILKKVMQYAD